MKYFPSDAQMRPFLTAISFLLGKALERFCAFSDPHFGIFADYLLMIIFNIIMLMMCKQNTYTA
jgi:hypothetical protein